MVSFGRREDVDPFLLASRELPPDHVSAYGTLASASAGTAAASVEQPAASSSAAPEQLGVPNAIATLGLRLNANAPLMKAKLRTPIFLENPDGTITEANPTRIQYKKFRAEADGSDVGSSGSEHYSPATVLHREVDVLYWRYERMMMLLLGAHLFLELLFNFVYVSRLGSSVEEFMSVYAWRQHSATGVAFAFFRAVFALQIIYSFTYYFLAGIALMTKKPHHYRVFVFWSLVGVLFQALLAYIDKFNLLIFCVRILALIYGRLLLNLAINLQLLPRA